MIQAADHLRPRVTDVPADVAVADQRAGRAPFLGHQKIFSITRGGSAWIPATSASMRSKV